MKMQTLAAALLIVTPAALFAQRSAPSVSEIVVTKVTDHASFALFKNAPNAKLEGTLADGTKFAYDVFITPTFARQLRAGTRGTGKTLAAEALASRHIKGAKLTCRKAGGTEWAELAKVGKNKEALASLSLVLTESNRAQPMTYMRYELKNVQVTSYSLSGSGDSSTMSLSLNFTKIEYKTTTMDDK